MKKQIFQIIEHSYEPAKEDFEDKKIPYSGIESIGMEDFFCWSIEETLFKKSGQLLEQRTYNGDYELNCMKLLVYGENDLLVKEIDTCIITDWNDIGTDYHEYLYENGRKVKKFFHQADLEGENDGYVEYIYSSNYSRIIDASQPNGSYKKLSEGNTVQIIEKWGISETEKVLLGGVLEEKNSNNEVVFGALFDDQYKIPSQKGYKNFLENGYRIQEWETGSQINYRKYDTNNNLIEEKTNNCHRVSYKYNEYNDVIEREEQLFSTEDVNGNKISDHPINVYTHDGGNSHIIRCYYLYDSEGNWVRKVSVWENKISSVNERKIIYF